MATRHIPLRQLSAGLLMAALLPLAPVRAQGTAAAPKGGLTSEDTLKSLEYRIEVDTVKRVNSKLSAYELAKELKLETPIMPPVLSREQVKAQIEQEVAKAVEEKYPAAHFDEIKADAKARFRMYDIGESITVRRLNRDNAVVEKVGRLREVKELNIIVADEKILRDDISAKDIMHFYREEYNKSVEEFVRAQSRLYTTQRDEYEAEERRKIGSAVWSSSGYIYWRGKSTWVPLYDYFYGMVEKKRRSLYANIRPEVQLAAMQKAGWTFNPDFGTWEPLVQVVAGTDPVTGAATTAAAATTPDKQAGVLERLKDFFAKGNAKNPPPAPVSVSPIAGGGSSVELWDDSDELFGKDKPATAAAPGTATTPPANDKVKSIFDE